MKSRRMTRLRTLLAAVVAGTFVLFPLTLAAQNYGVVDDAHAETLVIVINGQPHQANPDTEMRRADNPGALVVPAVLQAGMRVRFTAEHRGDERLPLLRRLTVLSADE